MENHKVNGVNTELRTYTCSQSWHRNVEETISYNVRVPVGTKDMEADEAVEAYVAVCGADFVKMCIEKHLPIEARLELRRLAGVTSVDESCSKDKLDKALALMPGWDYTPSEASGRKALKAENMQLKGQLAAAELNALREKRTAAEKLINAGLEEMALELYGESVVNAVKLGK